MYHLKRHSRWDGGRRGGGVDTVFRVQGRGDSTTALQPRGSTVVQGRFAYENEKRDMRVRQREKRELDERVRYKYG